VLSNSIEVSARVETGSDDEPGQSSGEQDRTPSLTSHDDPDETPDAWPYEEDENAEEEERAFDAFKAFFKPNISASNQSSRRNSGMQSSKEAIERFGEETAQSLVLTYRQIEKSLITYSSTWETGVIQDVSCGRLAKPLMLMCLQEERFAGANRAVLGKITEELESGKLIYRALKHWGVEDTYIQLVQWKKLPFQYVSKHRKQCQKCEIFVARAHACMEYLGFKRLTASMSEKVLSCLATMDNNLLGHSTKSHSRQNSYENQNPVANVSPLKSSQPSKKQVGTRFTSNGSADRKEATRAKSSDRKEYLEVKSSDLTEKKKDTKRKASSDVQAKERRKAAKLSEGQSSRTLRSSPTKLSEGQSSRTLRSSPTRTPASSFASVRSLPVSKSSIALAPPRSACDAPEIDGGDDAKKSNTNTKFFDPNFFRDFVRGKRAPEIDGGHDAKKSNKNTELLDQNDQCDFEEKRKRSLGKLPQESANEAEHSKSGKGKQTIGPEPKKSASSQPSEIPAAVLRHVEQFIPVSGDGAPSLKAITAMDEVEESPYLSNRSAEVGEEIFDSFKAFLEPQDDRGRHLEPSNEAAQAFGKALAKSVVKAYSEIAKSGMTYGSSWKDGVIRGINCGFIPRPMMLLCLQEQRLAIGTEDVLARIISDLGVCGIVTDAIEHWKLQKNYPLLNTFSSLSGLHAKKHSTLRCIVFVARTYRCMIALQRRSIGDSLMKKVQACLSIIHLSLERQAEHKMHKASGSDKGSASHYKSKSRREKIAPKPASPPEQVPARFHSLEHDSGDTESALPTTTRIMHNLLEKSPTSRNDSPSKKGDQAFFPHRLMGKSFRQQTHELAALERQAPADLPMKEPPAQEHPSNSAANSIHAQPSQKANDTRALLKEPTQAQTNTTLTTPHGKVVQLPTLDKKKKPIGPWYPIDENEMILNATEAELAWLTEESTFSLRSERNDIQWDFVWQYASPSLKIELRRIPDDSGSRLDRLVRLDDGLVNKRFDVVRKEIRSKLYRGVLRTMMRGVIPVLRHKTRQYNTK
jgi:flagellar biosynthesis GTPase FlhF